VHAGARYLLLALPIERSLSPCKPGSMLKATAWAMQPASIHAPIDKQAAIKSRHRCMKTWTAQIEGDMNKSFSSTLVILLLSSFCKFLGEINY
jgi:hypothetical protein